MPPPKPTLSLSIWSYFAAKFIFLAFLLCTVAVSYPFFALADKFPRLPLQPIGALTALCGLGCSVYFTLGMRVRMKEDPTMGVRRAFMFSFYELVTYLAFLPIVGGFFDRVGRGTKNESPFRQPQSESFRKD